MRYPESESLWEAMIEPLHGEVNLLMGDGSQVALSREIRTDEPIGALVGTPLPGGIGVGKVDLSLQGVSH